MLEQEFRKSKRQFKHNYKRDDEKKIRADNSKKPARIRIHDMREILDKINQETLFDFSDEMAKKGMYE